MSAENTAPQSSPANLTVEDLARSLAQKRNRAAATPATAPAAQPPAAPAAETEPNTPPAEPGQPNAPAAESTEGTTDLPEQTPAPGPEPESAAPTGEAEPAPEPEPAAADDDDQDEPESTPASDPAAELKRLQKENKKLHKRVDKLTARLHDAAEAPPNGQPQPQAPQAPQAAPAPAVPPEHPLLAPINNDLKVLNGFLDWARQNPDGGTYVDPRTNQPREYDADQVAEIKQNVIDARTNCIARHGTITQMLEAEFHQSVQHWEAEAKKAYPELADPNSKLSQDVEALGNALPGIRQNTAGWKMAVADMLRGQKARTAAAAKPPAVLKPMSRPKGSPNPTPVVIAPATTAPRINGNQKAVQDAWSKFQKTGSQEDMAKWRAAQRQARTAAGTQ